MKTKVGVVSLGCDKNRVDTEVMLANLVAGGYEITSEPSEADVIIVNTCAFLESARKEAIDTILEMANFKRDGRCQKVIVTGCLGQKFGDELYNDLYEADAIVGTYEYDKICDIVAETLTGERNLYRGCNEGITFGARVLTTAPHVAYLKIADGCDNYCTYCLIPYIRGRYRSVTIESAVEQARELADRGVKELILVAQDVTRYGKDLYGEPKLVELIQQLSQIQQIQWIRLLYCYPELMTDALIEEIVNNPKVVNYVDIPLQHVNDGILRKMNRRSNAQSIRTLFDKLMQKGITVRSTFICGFPGETNDTVAELDEFLRNYKLRNVGFFAYSREEGTKAAQFDNQVHPRTKQRYVKQLYATQYRVATALNQGDVGAVYQCIIDESDGCDGEFYLYKGRTYFMTPEIDGCVYVTSRKQLEAGNTYSVKITGVLEYDLVGEVVE
ncbi:MAG: 30S ribosomal protein S12 methylthiotransferase RimO [Clostridiales bacterium]|nr:30S ribosomal protein S12 methylthiotransferase RimO [Clostridiales bacterium]